MIVKVTQEDIDEAKRRLSSGKEVLLSANCPLAIALKKDGQEWLVSDIGANTLYKSFTLSDTLAFQVRNFTQKQEFQPGEYELLDHRFIDGWMGEDLIISN